MNPDLLSSEAFQCVVDELNIMKPRIIVASPITAPSMDQRVILPTTRRPILLSGNSTGRASTQMHVKSEAANWAAGKNSDRMNITLKLPHKHDTITAAAPGRVRKPQ
jgi:hypothetical protein